MRHVLFCFATMLIAAGSSGVRQVELTLHPSPPLESAKAVRLLPETEKMTNADAAPLYEKAAQFLPAGLDTNQIQQWLGTPLDKLPQQEIQSLLEQVKPALQSLSEAAKCRVCNWPASVSGTMPAYLSEYRELARIFALKARLEMAQGRQDEAIGTIRTGLAAAKHIGESPTLIQGLVGLAMGAITVKQVEGFIQIPGTPNLSEALGRLPKPLINLGKAMQSEVANLKSDPRFNVLTRKTMENQLKSAHERIRLTMKRLDRHVAVLQCIEALRLYAGANQGKFPDALADITQAPVPNDPVIEKPFSYKRTGSQAFLRGPAPEGREAKEAIDYTLKLEK
ncbi:MAG: hypothetical protein JXN61_08460 [Sedimentisphaerales bacterium]|nr:hypothetical protein [Sedimentisphaerales bacterium]